MIRYTLLTLVITFLLVYAWRDWFKALCGLVLFMAVLERPDMPRELLGIPGLNPWNLVMLSVFPAWLVARSKEKLTVDLPPLLLWLFGIYITLMIVSTARMLGDMGPMNRFATMAGLSSASRGEEIIELVNNLKFLLPGIMLFDGCRNRERWWWAVGTMLLTGFVMALQIIKLMPLGLLVDGDLLQKRALRVLDRQVGYHRVDLAAIMASLSWAFMAVTPALTNKALRWTFVACSGVSFMAVLLTGGRTGFIAWGAVGAVFAILRYRFMLVLGPALVLVALALVPAARERLLEGFTPDTYETGTQSMGVNTIDEGGRDLYAVTSGRILVWPVVLSRIEESPIIGYGRVGMQRSGASQEVFERYGQPFAHPHNAYLEWTIDNGILGLIPVVWFFAIVVFSSLSLLMSKSSKTAIATGGIGLAFVLGQLVASLASQSFYPRQGVVLMWCAIGLTLRFAVESQRVRVAGRAPVAGRNGTMQGART